MIKPLIMIVEDEPALVQMLRYNLEAEGYRVAEASDGEQALMLIEEEPPDLLLLDWMLPLVSGLEVCRRIKRGRKTKDIPIILLTARGEEEDVIRGLDTGADDYVIKPFVLSMLYARIRAALRRTGIALMEEKLECKDLSIDLISHRVMRAGKEVHLGPTEYHLLCHLMAKPTRVFSREQLLDAVWGRDRHVEIRTVDVHIRRLRKALNADGQLDIIRTVRAAGYSLGL